MRATPGHTLLVAKILAVAAVFGALQGAKIAAEGNFALRAAEMAKRHVELGRTGENDPSLAEALSVLALVATEREAPGSLQRSERAARQTVLQGHVLLGVSIVCLVGLGAYGLRVRAGGRSTRPSNRRG